MLTVLIGKLREIGFVRRPGAQGIIKPRFDHGPVGAAAPPLIAVVHAKELPILGNPTKVIMFRGLAIAGGIGLAWSERGRLAPIDASRVVAPPFRLDLFDAGEDFARIGQPPYSAGDEIACIAQQAGGHTTAIAGKKLEAHMVGLQIGGAGWLEAQTKLRNDLPMGARRPRPRRQKVHWGGRRAARRPGVGPGQAERIAHLSKIPVHTIGPHRHTGPG